MPIIRNPELRTAFWPALAANVPIGVPAYSVGFLLSYFLNDLPGASDLRRFLLFGLFALPFSIALACLILVRAATMPAREALVATMIWSLLFHGLFLLVTLPLIL